MTLTAKCTPGDLRGIANLIGTKLVNKEVTEGTYNAIITIHNKQYYIMMKIGKFTPGVGQ